MEFNKAKELRNRVGGYVEHPAPARLERFIEALWTYGGDGAMTAALSKPHLIVPDTGVSVVFACRRRANGRVDDPRLLFYGPVMETRDFAPRADRRFAALRLAPEWSTGVLGAHPRDLWNAIDDLSAIAPDLAGLLMDRLAATTNNQQALGILTREIGGVIEGANIGAHDDTPGTMALRIIRACSGATTVDWLVRCLEVSERHLRRQVRGLIGLAPKSFTRLTRFIAAMRQADRQPKPRWADLAVRFGYYDQAHMIRDFTALCGRTPRALHRERRAESEICNSRPAA